MASAVIRLTAGLESFTMEGSKPAEKQTVESVGKKVWGKNLLKFIFKISFYLSFSFLLLAQFAYNRSRGLFIKTVVTEDSGGLFIKTVVTEDSGGLFIKTSSLKIQGVYSSRPSSQKTQNVATHVHPQPLYCITAV